jgi:hypothetical protein
MESVLIPGRHQPTDDGTPIDSVEVGDGYFDALGIPIVEGRAIDAADLEAQRKVVVVNQAMARQYWPGKSAVGERIYAQGFEHEPHVVIGVARDHKVRSVGEAPRPYLHFPATPARGVAIAVRTQQPSAAALPSLRAVLLKMEPNIVFTEDAPAASVIASTLAPTRIGAVLLAAFGSLALLLAAVGLYGVVAYSVSLRTREVGVRMALGARPRDVAALVLRQGGRLAVVGLALGTLGAALVSRVLESLLYGVGTVDPVAYAAAIAILLTVAAVANVVPALGAARIDPLRALRSE